MFFILNFVSTADIILILSRQCRNYLLTPLHIHGDTLEKNILIIFRKEESNNATSILKT